MASAVDSRLAYARPAAVATASRLPTATRDSNNSYTTSWDTTPCSRYGVGQGNMAVTPFAALRQGKPRFSKDSPARRMKFCAICVGAPQAKHARRNDERFYAEKKGD